MEKIKLFRARMFLVKLFAVMCASSFFSFSAVAGAEDLSSLVSVTKSNEVSITDRVTLQATTTVNLTIQNLSDKSIQGPLHAVIDITAAGVTMPTALGGPGVLPYGKYYYDLSSKLSAGVLPPQGKVTFTVKFVRAASVRFTYKVVTYGTLPTNKQPVANAGTVAPLTLQRGQTAVSVQLDGSASSDADGTVTAYTWTGPVDPADVAKPSVSLGVGTHTFTLVVTDDKGAQSQPSQVTVVVNPPPNEPPVAKAGDNRTIQLLPGEQTATVTLSGSGTDVDGTVVSFAWSGTPKPADIAAPTVTLSPGTYYFDLVVTDNQGASSAPSRVTVQVVRAENRPPQLDPIGAKTLAEGQTLSFTVSGSDLDGDPLIFSVKAGLPAGASFDTASRTFSWTPGYDAAGKYDVTFSISDGMVSAEEIVFITVTNTNRPPVLTHIGTKTVAEGQKLEFAVTGTDPDNDPLTAGGKPLPAGALLDPVTGLFSWTPGFTHAGTYQITFSLSDGTGPTSLAAEEIVSITVTDVNRKPTIVTQSLPAPKIDYAYTPAVVATDPDGDALTFAIGVGAPSKMVIDPATGVIKDWRPGIGEVGKSYTFDVTVSDGKGATDSRQYTIAVSDTVPPAIVLNVPKEAIPGSSITATASATDNVAVTELKIVAGGQEKTCPAPSCDAGTAPCPPVTCAIDISLSPVQAIGSSIAVDVTARDAAGNTAGATKTVTTVALPDTVKPSVIFSAPLEVTVGKEVTLSALAADDQGVDRLRFTADGAPVGSAIPPANSVSYIPVASAGQKIIFGVTAFDFSGNEASATVESTVVEQPDTLAPAITMSVPPVVKPGAKLPVTLKVTDDRGVALVEIYLAHQKAASFASALDQVVELPLPPGAEPGLQLIVEVRAVDAANNSATASAESMVAVPGQGVITGAVYDDTTGLPLEGATVTASIPSKPPRETLTDRRGRYSLAADEGAYSVAATKTGYTSADRPGVVVVVQKGVRVPDARLTPLGEDSPVSTMLGTTVSASFSAAAAGFSSALAAGDSPGTVKVSFPSGAFAADRAVAVTQVGGQGLQGRLPYGWSPVGSIDIAPHGIALGVAGSVSMPNLFGSSLPSQAVVALWREDAGSWWSLGSPVMSADGATLTFELPATGQYAVIVPDAATQALPVAGARIEPVAPATVPETVQAAVTPQPKFILYKPGAKSLVGTRIVADASLTSGTVVWANIAEDYSFYSGDRIISEPYFQEIVLYSFGRAGTITADYYISAGEDFAGLTLQKGVITVTAAVPPAGSGSVAVVGSAGGTVVGPGGESLIFPSGALNGFVPVTVKTFSLPESGLSIPAGFRLVGGVTFSLAGQMLAKPVTLTVPVPADFVAGGDLLVVTPVETGGATRLAIIGAATAEATAITSTITIPGTTTARFPGIRSEGRVLVLQAAQALGYAGGTVTGTGKIAFVGAVVTGGGLPFIALSGDAGFYATVVAPGPVDLTALDPVKLDQGTSGSTVAAHAYLPLDLSLKIEPPKVIGTAPAKGAVNVPLADPVKITLSEPVTAGSVTSLNVRVASAAGDVPGSIDLSSDGMVVTFRHMDPFASKTLYTVTVEKLVDRSGTVMAAPFASSFTTIDTAPPPAPPAGTVIADIPSNGRSTIVATQGTASPHDKVFIVNLATGERTPVIVDSDGGFTVTINATDKDKLQIEITSPAGVTTTVQLPRFQKTNPDGSISSVIGAEGGRITLAGNVNVDIPANAFPAGAVVKVKALTEAELGIPVPAAFPFVSGLEIEATAAPKVYLNVSAPMPAGTDPRTNGVVVQVIDAYGARAYGLVDTAKMINGRLATSSPPCQGITDRVGRYALLLNDDQRMKYETTLARIIPPKQPLFSMIIETFYAAIDSFFFPESAFKLKVDANANYDTLCMPLPPNQTATFVFRDARTGEVVRSIPMQNTSTPGSMISVSYVDTSDRTPPNVVEILPANKTLSLGTRTIRLRFNEPIIATNIGEVIKLVDPAQNDSVIPIDIVISENNTVATITPKQLLTMGKRFRLKISEVKDLANNTCGLPFIDFLTYAPKMVFPTSTSQLDPTTVASHLGVQASAITTTGLVDLDFNTTPPQKSSDGKWHTDLIGVTTSWGFGYGYRTFTFDASDATKPKALAGLPAGTLKYMQKVQYLKNVSLIPRDVPATAEWRGRQLHYVVADPTNRLCADPATATGAAEIVRWQTLNGCDSSSGACAITTGGCGDLALATGYDPVYSQFWMYDVTNLSSPNWFFGARLLSDNGAERGYPRRKNSPAGFGMARRFSLFSPVDISHGNQTHTGALAAYIAVPGIGLEQVDVGLNIPDIGDFERGTSTDPLTVSEKIGLNTGGIYYQDVQIVSGKVVAIAGDRMDGTGIRTLEIFGTDVSGPRGMIALSHIPNKMAVREAFVKYDANGDQIAEPHDVAVISGFDGGLSVVEIPADGTTAPELLAFMKTPAGTYTQHVEIDPVEKVAYVGARWVEGEVTINGLLVADISRLGVEAGSTVDSAGWDTRFVGRIPISTPANGNVSIKGFRIDRQRGLLYAGVDSSDSFVVIKISECADLQVDFTEPSPRVSIPAEVEKKALQKVFNDGIAQATLACSSSAIVGMKVLEQGSGACVWRGTCKGNYQPGISDHDYEIFFPQSVDEGKRNCVIKRLYAQVRDDVNDEPKTIEVDGYRLAFEDITFFPMTREEFEAGKLNVEPPPPSQGDSTGDMGLGRQMLLLKWLLEGAYVEGTDYDLKGRALNEILSILRAPIYAVPVNPALDEPSHVKRLEGYEWAKLQEAEIYASSALIRFYDEAKPGTTLAHTLEKQLHKVGKAGIRAVLAKMIANKDGNGFVLGNAVGNVHVNGSMTCLNVNDSETTTDWVSEPCDSFEHWVASVAARTARDTLFNLFTPADIKNIVYPLYRMKAGKLHLDDDVKVNEFLGRSFTFITDLGKDGGPAKTVYSATITGDADQVLRGTNLGNALTRITNVKSQGKKQIVPRILNKGGRQAKDILLHLHVPDETAKETVALEPAEIRHVDTKKIPDPGDVTKKKTVKVFSLTGIDQGSTSNGNKWASFLFDLPEKRAEEPDRKNNWAKLYYYVLDPASPSIPTPGDPPLPIADTDPPSLLEPDNVCIDRLPGLKVEQYVDHMHVDSATLYIGGSCKTIEIVVTNTSLQTMKNVRVYSSITAQTYTMSDSLAPGGSASQTFSYCPAPTVITLISEVVPEAEDTQGHALPLAATVDTVKLVTSCPVAIIPHDPDPNPEVSEIGFGGTAYRYYTVTKISQNSLAPMTGADVRVEFLTSAGIINKNYTTDDKGTIVLPVTDPTPTTDEKGLAMPWDMWQLTSIPSNYTDHVQATIRVNGEACVEPVKFSVSRKPFEFEESIKAGAALKASGSIFGKLALGAGGSLTLGTKRKYDGATTTQDNFSVSRGAGLSVGLAFKPEIAFKIQLGASAKAGAGVNAGIKVGGIVGDKYEFPLPLAPVQKKQVAGLLLDTLNESQAFDKPILSFIGHHLIDAATGFSAARTSRSVGVSAEGELSGEAAIGFVPTRIKMDKDAPVAKVGASLSGKMGLSFGGDADEKEKKFGMSMEVTGELAVSGGLQTGKFQEEATSGTGNELNGVRTIFKKAEELFSAGGGYSGGAKIGLTLNTDLLPEKMSFSISQSKNWGWKSFGEAVEDLGAGSKETFTLSVEGFDRVKPILVSMADIASSLAGEATKLRLGIPTQNILVTASSIYEKYMKFGHLMLDKGTYSVDVESGSTVTIPVGIKAVAGAGFELELKFNGEHTSGYSLRSGVVSKGRFYKLTEYPPNATAPLEMSLTNLMDDLWTGVSDSVSGYFHGVVKISEPTTNTFQWKSLGSAELNLQSDADFKVVSNLLAYSFTPIPGPVKPLLYSPHDVTGAAGKPHYGIGGFQNFTPESGQLASPGTLIINYHDPEVEGLDEASLSIYRWNDTRMDWDQVSGVHDLNANTITTQVSRLGLYTLAPAMPAGKVTWTVSSVEHVGIENDAKTFVNLTAGPFMRNNGTPVPADTEFHVFSVSPFEMADAAVPYGTILSSDANPDVEGVQHRVGNDGLLHARLELPGTPPAVRLLTFSDIGTAYGEDVVPLDKP